MLKIFEKWYRRYFFEEESILLLVLLAVALVLLMTIGNILAPVLAAIVLAYLAQGLAARLQGLGLPEWLGVLISYLVFIGVFFGVTLGLVPLVWRQMVGLAGELPRMLEQMQQFLGVLPERYPNIITKDQLGQVIDAAQSEIAGLGQTAVTRTLASIPGLFIVLVYMILIPMLVFFFLKDRKQILQWLGSFLPQRRPLLRQIWLEMDIQVANYARGKALEVIVVGAVFMVDL